MLVEGVEITHLLPEQCHSKPVSEKGSLVFYNFGWDILAMLKTAEFGDAYMVSYYSHFWDIWVTDCSSCLWLKRKGRPELF